MSDDSYSEVIVGTDGSETAERAVRAAAMVASELDVPLIVATSWYRDMPDEPVPSELAEYPSETPGGMEAGWAEQTVSDGAAIARTSGVPEVRTSTPQGAPADALIQLAGDHPGALLVVGTVGLGSRTERFLGNVPHQVTHHSPTDVLLVRTPEHEVRPYRDVALATDGSDTAARAVTAGVALARAIGADATLVTVASDEATGGEVLDDVAATVDGTGALDHRVLVGRRVTDTLADAADDYDLLVIGNKGMSGPSRLLGSVANAITHQVPTDLLLVNTTKRGT